MSFKDWVTQPAMEALDREARLDEMEARIEAKLRAFDEAMVAIDDVADVAKKLASSRRAMDALGKQVSARLSEASELQALLDAAAKAGAGVTDEMIQRVVEPVVRAEIKAWFDRADRMAERPRIISASPGMMPMPPGGGEWAINPTGWR